MKVAVVGAGYWGKNLVRVSLELGILEIVCDTSIEILKNIEEKFKGIKTTTDIKEIIQNEKIEGVIVSSPASTHYELTRKILSEGKDVFVEKPLALRVEEGEELVEISEKNGCILMVGHILHYHPAVKKMKEIIEKGEIGKIQYIYSNRLNIGRIRNEENILWSFAPHDISLLLSLTEEMPENVFSYGGIFLPHNVEDVTLTFFSFPSGVKAHIFVSWLNPFKEQKFVVVGSERMIVFDDTQKEKKLTIYSHKINWKNNELPTIEKCKGEIVQFEDKEPLKEEVKHFVKCIEKREKPLTDGKEGLKVLKVLQMAEKSLKRSYQ